MSATHRGQNNMHGNIRYTGPEGSNVNNDECNSSQEIRYNNAECI